MQHTGAALPSLPFRLCDKSPSVRKRAVALLAALLQQQAASLAPAAAAELADAVLPVASKLLGVRPDSGLHLGEDGVKVSRGVPGRGWCEGEREGKGR